MSWKSFSANLRLYAEEFNSLVFGNGQGLFYLELKMIFRIIFIVILSVTVTIQPVFAVNIQTQDCLGYEQDKATLNKQPNAYYFKLALCEVKFIHDEQSFSKVINYLNKSVQIPGNATASFEPEAYFLMGILYINKYNSGNYLYNSPGQPQDLIDSIHNYEKAASLGSVLAENNLGEVYLDELNLDQSSRIKKEIPNERAIIQLPNMDKAIYWLTYASKNGNPAAQGTLSNLYEQGIGVPQDYVLAYVWQILSSAGQSKYNRLQQVDTTGLNSLQLNRKIRDKIYSKLTATQKDQAQLLLQDYIKTALKQPSAIDIACRDVQAYVALLDMKKIFNKLSLSS